MLMIAPISAAFSWLRPTRAGAYSVQRRYSADSEVRKDWTKQSDRLREFVSTAYECRWDRCHLQARSPDVCFREIEVYETFVPYPCDLGSIADFHVVLRIVHLPVTTSCIPTDDCFHSSACRKLRRPPAGTHPCRPRDRSAIRTTNRTVREK